MVVKSVLGALGNEDSTLQNQREAISEMRRVLKTGAPLLFAENMKASPMHSLLRHHLVPWGPRWQYFAQRQLTDLLSDFAAIDLCFRGFVATLGRSEWQRSLLHAFDSVIKREIVTPPAVAFRAMPGNRSGCRPPRQQTRPLHRQSRSGDRA